MREFTKSVTSVGIAMSLFGLRQLTGAVQQCVDGKSNGATEALDYTSIRLVNPEKNGRPA